MTMLLESDLKKSKLIWMHNKDVRKENFLLHMMDIMMRDNNDSSSMPHYSMHSSYRFGPAGSNYDPDTTQDGL